MIRVFALLLAWFATAAGAAAQAQANVLLIVADDLGVDFVGAYGEGSNPPPTPHLDALAAQGVLFRNAWAYPTCSPTRAALLTGRHPLRTMVGRFLHHLANNNPWVGTLRAEEWTLPELLDRAGSGYAHACIGKWHLHDASFPVSAPEDIGGFDTFTGYFSGQLPSYTTWDRVHNRVEQTVSSYATIQQTDDALAWIGAQTGPWFCYLNYCAPHVPFHVPPAHLHTRQVSAASPNRDKFPAMVESLDTELGRLLGSIDPAVLANTHVLFIGDNGSVQGMADPPFDPLRAKGSLYEGGINVPLLYRGPAAVAPGREVTALACAVDVFATVLELTGAQDALPPWRATDGQSLVPYLQDPAQPPLRQFAYSEVFTGNQWPAPVREAEAAVRDDRYKLIDRYIGFDEMFDLVADPFEQVNLLAGPLTPAQLQRRDALRAEIQRLRTPRARCAVYGTPCAGRAGPPQIGCSGVPAFGRAYKITLQNAPPGAIVVIAMGLSHVQESGIPLPIDLGRLGAGAGCMQWLSLDAMRGMLADGAGSAVQNLPVPNEPELMEQTVLHGWFVRDPAAPGNAAGLVTTAGLVSVVGL